MVLGGARPPAPGEAGAALRWGTWGALGWARGGSRVGQTRLRSGAHGGVVRRGRARLVASTLGRGRRGPDVAPVSTR
jgi:hypothetical protein